MPDLGAAYTETRDHLVDLDQIKQIFAPNDIEPYLAFISPYPLPVAPLVV